MIRHPAWCPCCILHPGSSTPATMHPGQKASAGLVSREVDGLDAASGLQKPGWMPSCCSAPCVHLPHPQLPTVLSTALHQNLNKQKPGRMIQPSACNSSNHLAKPYLTPHWNLTKFGLSWTVQRVQLASRLRNAHLPSLGVFAIWFGVPGNLLNNMFHYKDTF